MAVIPAITIQARDASYALKALERRWKAAAIGFIGEAAYEALSGPEKAQECIKAEIRISVRNLRREEAERAIIVADVELT